MLLNALSDQLCDPSVNKETFTQLNTLLLQQLLTVSMHQRTELKQYIHCRY